MTSYVSSAATEDVILAAASVMTPADASVAPTNFVNSSSTNAAVATRAATSTATAMATAASLVASACTAAASTAAVGKSAAPILARRALIALLALIVRKCILNAGTRIATIAASSSELKRLGRWPAALEGKEEDFWAISAHVLRHEGLMGFFLRASDADVILTVPVLVAQRCGRLLAGAIGAGADKATELLLYCPHLEAAVAQSCGEASAAISSPLHGGAASACATVIAVLKAAAAAALPTAMALPPSMVRAALLTHLHTDLKSDCEKPFYFHRYGGMRNCARRLYRGGGRTMKSFFLSSATSSTSSATAHSPASSAVCGGSSPSPPSLGSPLLGSPTKTVNDPSALAPSANGGDTAAVVRLFDSPAADEEQPSTVAAKDLDERKKCLSPMAALTRRLRLREMTRRCAAAVARLGAAAGASRYKGALLTVGAVVAWHIAYAATSLILRRVLLRAVLLRLGGGGGGSVDVAGAAAAIVGSSSSSTDLLTDAIVAAASGDPKCPAFDTASVVGEIAASAAQQPHHFHSHSGSVVVGGRSAVAATVHRCLRHAIGLASAYAATAATHPIEVVRCRMLLAARSGGNGGAVGEDGAVLTMEYPSIGACCAQIVSEGEREQRKAEAAAAAAIAVTTSVAEDTAAVVTTPTDEKATAAMDESFSPRRPHAPMPLCPSGAAPLRLREFWRGSRVALVAIGWLSVGDLVLDALLASRLPPISAVAPL